MNARTISYILDGLAVKLREGLNQEGYGLQEAARRLRELAPDERDRETHETCESYVKEAVESLQGIISELKNVYWNLEWQVKPKAPASESPSETLHRDFPEGVACGISDIPF